MAWFGKKKQNLDATASADVLIRKLTDPDPQLRSNIEKNLTSMGVAIIPNLAAGLSHPNSLVRSTCAKLLGQLGGPPEVARLLDVLVSDYHMDVMQSANEALKKLMQGFVHSHLYHGNPEDKLFVETHKQVFSPLKEAIATPKDPSKERVVIDMLLSVQDDAMVTLVLELFLESTLKIREMIKRAIARCDDDRKTAAVEKALKSDNNDLHRAFLEVLVGFSRVSEQKRIIFDEGLLLNLSISNREYIGRTPLIDIVVSESNSLDLNRRMRVTQLVATLSGHKALSVLTERLADPAAEIRAQAAIGLGELRSKAAQVVLVKALEDQETAVVFQSLSSLVRIGHPDIIALLNQNCERSPEIRALAVAEISRLSNDAYWHVLCKMTEQERHKLGRTLKESSPHFMATLHNDLQASVVNKRTRALQLASKLGYTEQMLPDMVSLILDPDRVVRATAISSIGEIIHPKITEIMLKSLTDPDERVRANAIEKLTGADYGQIRPFLLRFVKDKNSRIRANACQVLYHFAPVDAVREVLDMLNSKEENMVLSALWLIREEQIVTSDILPLVVRLAGERFRTKIAKSALQTISIIRSQQK